MINEMHAQNLKVTLTELTQSLQEFEFFVRETDLARIRWEKRTLLVPLLKQNDWTVIKRKQDIPALEKLHAIALERKTYLEDRLVASEDVLTKMREYRTELEDALQSSEIGSMLNDLSISTTDQSEEMAGKVQALLHRSRQIAFTTRAFEEIQQNPVIPEIPMLESVPGDNDES